MISSNKLNKKNHHSQHIEPESILEFYLRAEKLRTILRHSWLSTGKRQESVAEHSWMMSLMALTILPHLQQKLNVEKVFLMITIHDLAEAVTTDLPVWQGSQQKEAKFQAEKKALKKIIAPLDSKTKKMLIDAWEEYEERQTPEAVFVKAIDTLDVLAQHLAAPIETWDNNDYEWMLSPVQHAYFQYEPFLQKVKNTLDRWNINKLKKAGSLSRLDQTKVTEQV